MKSATATYVIAQELRELVITMVSGAGSGHPAAALGMADIFSVLYFTDLLSLDPTHPNEPERDRVILSAGHICPVWYAALAKRGFFSVEELSSLRHFGSRLQGHPHHSYSTESTLQRQKVSSSGRRVIEPDNLPGVENTAGSLGQGASFAVGLALGLRYQHHQHRLTRLPRVICLLGDGELDEGQVWEAFMSAAKFKLNHLTFMIDRNDIQIDGFTHQVLPLEPLKDKLLSFGLCPIEVDGHNHASIYNALQPDSPLPIVILAHTTPGKGVSFMEGKYEWHGKAPTAEEAARAVKELAHV